MPSTPLLGLPLMAAAQAQKHVTHNEALSALDALVFLAVLSRRQASPPPAPNPGDRYLVAANPTGAWAGQAGTIALFADSVWRFFTPLAGWIMRVQDEAHVLSFDGTLWVDLVAAGGLTQIENLVGLGVGTASDPTNSFAFKGNNLLLTAKAPAEGGTGDLRAKLNKAAAGNTLSLLFQDGFAGRAELGLVGDDDVVLKVSSDGAAWTEALRVKGQGGFLQVVNATADAHALNRLTADGRYLAQGAQAADSAKLGGVAAASYLTTASPLAWGKLAGTPTTLAGYGVTDPVLSYGPQSLTQPQQQQAIANLGVGGAWTAYTPALVAGSNAFGQAAASGQYLKIGKTVVITVTVTITTNGQAGGYVGASLPAPANGDFILFGREMASTGAMLIGWIVNGQANLRLFSTSNAYPGFSGAVLTVSGVYQSL